MLVGATYFVRQDVLLMTTVLATALLAVLTLLPRIQVVLLAGFAFLNALLMFFYFYRFFSAAPMLDYTWYTQVEYMPIWVVLLGGFASMYILADNSCCLKREQEIDSETKFQRAFGDFSARRQESSELV